MSGKNILIGTLAIAAIVFTYLFFEVLKYVFRVVNQKNFMNNYQPAFSGWWVGSGAWGENSSFANFGRALACAICKCAVLWVGFLSSFFAGGRKKQNKFPSNLHCPVKKLNHFLFQIVAIVSVCSSVFLHF